MLYEVEPIKHLTKLVSGQDDSRIWLKENNFSELILLHFALDGNEAALLELTKKKFVDLVAFTHAVLDDKHAFNWLGENKKYIWAATVRVTYKDPSAEAWLIRNKLTHFAELGKAILRNEENEQADDIFGVIKKSLMFILNPFKK